LDPGEITYYNNKSAVILEKIKKSGSSDFSEVKDLWKKAIEVGTENPIDFKNIAKAMKRIGTCYENEGDISKGMELIFYIFIDYSPFQLFHLFHFFQFRSFFM